MNRCANTVAGANATALRGAGPPALRPWFARLVCLGLWVVSSHAQGQDAQAQDAKAQDAKAQDAKAAKREAAASEQTPAVKTLLRGHTELGHGDKQAALLAYRSAYRRAPRFDTAANLGLLELALGQQAMAAHHLAAAIRLQPSKVDAALIGRLQTALRTAKKGLAAFVVRAEAPAGSELRVDGKVVARTPLLDPVFVPPGRHQLLLVNGDAKSEATYTIVAGQKKQVSLKLKQGSRQLNQVQATIVVSGSALAVAAFAAGGAMLYGSIRRDGNVSEKREALAAYAGNCALAPQLCLEIANNEGARDDLRLGAIVAFSGGAAMALGTTIYGILASRSNGPQPSASKTRETASRVYLHPRVAPGFAGLQVGGSF